MSEITFQPEITLACDLTVFTDEERDNHIAQSNRLFATVEEVRELPDGYKFRLPSSNESLSEMIEFIKYDRLCCPFFTFGIEVEPNHGPMWLVISGVEAVKQFLAIEFTPMLKPEVAAAAGLRETA